MGDIIFSENSLFNRPIQRSCDGCTKCCEGWLEAEIYGIPMYPGRPCHFKSNSGCSIYENRPESPCKEYQCMWLTSSEIPEWMKPNEINTIVSKRQQGNISWIEIREAGSILDSSVLSWFVVYCFKNNINLCYSLNGSANYIGQGDFVRLMESL